MQHAISIIIMLINNTQYNATYYRIAGNFRGGANFRDSRESRNFQPTKFSTEEFSVGYCASAAQPGEYGVNRTHVLKGSNSYRNVSLSLSTPHRVRRRRSHTIAIRPSFHTHRSRQRGEAEARPPSLPPRKRRGWQHTEASTGLVLPSNASVKNLPMTSFAYRASGGEFLSDANNRRGHIYRHSHAARSDRSCNFGCISGMKEFYDKPHVYFEDSLI